MIVCLSCGRSYVYIRSAGHTMSMCNSCSVNNRRFALKKKMLEYKGSVCKICGYNKCSDAMCFHHLDPGSKDFNISGSHSRSWLSISKELDKCVLLCVRCHAEVHAGVVTVDGDVG